MTTYNTMNPVPSADARDRFDNSQVFDEYVTGTDLQTPDRMGVMRKTLTGLENDFNTFLLQSGFEPNHLTYVDGSPLQVDRPTQLIDRAGSVYRVKMPASFPVELTGTWAIDEGALVDVGDQSLRTALAASTGSTLIGHGSRTVYESLDPTPFEFGAVGDGAADDTAALQAWADSSDSTRKHLPAGTYKISAKITFKPGDYVYGDGVSSVIDASAGIGGALQCLGVTGSLVALPALAQNVTKRFNVLEFSSAPDLSLGDVVLIWNPTAKSWSTWRDDYRAGEWCRVATVSGTTVSVYGLTYDAYIAGSVELYKLNGPQAIFKDFVIKQPATSNVGLHVEFIDSPVIENVFASGSTYAGLSVQKCVDIDINCRPRQSSAATGNNYGLAVGNSQGGSIRGHYYGTRHAVSLGGATGVGSVSCRNMDVFASMSNLQVGGIAAQDLHGNTEDIRFHGGTFTNGGVVAGKDNKFFGCNFLGRSGNGIALLMGEVKGGTFEFVGCRFETVVNPNSSDGIISCQNFTANVIEDCNFVFTGTTIRCPDATVFPIIFALNGTLARINVSFNGGLTFLAAAAITQVLRIRNFQASGDFGTIAMKEVTGIPQTGCAYVSEVGSVTISRYKLPRQVGSVSVPVTTAASTFDAAVTFAHSYPTSRVPNVIANHTNPTIGGKRITSGHTGTTNTGFSARVQTTDTAVFGSSGTAGVTWSAELEEQ